MENTVTDKKTCNESICDIGVLADKENISYDFMFDTVQNLLLDCKFLSNANSNRYLTNFHSKYGKIYDKIIDNRMKYNDFNVLKIIGQGAFGQVQLVRHKPTGDLFALKILNKSQVLTCEGTIFWREERDIMAEIKSRWIVKMHYAFQDSKRLYMVMDYLPGGNLVTWMSKIEVLSEKDVCFYAAEIVLAINALHNYGFVHRDIKPDNILFDKSGHIKLADFGSCVKMDPKTKYVNCNRAIGTPDYISPEVLLSQSNNTKYGREVDWWALGVMLYEIFYGEPPFYSDNLVNTYSKIMTHEQSLSFPEDEDVSEGALEFMKSLICDRSIRLGQAHDAGDIKSHRFFAPGSHKWNWDNIQDFHPPFIPQLENDLDTSYFDFDVEDVDKNFLTQNSSELKPTVFSGENLQFSGFSYTKYQNTIFGQQKENVKSEVLSENRINMSNETNKDVLDKLLIEKKDLENQLHTMQINLKKEEGISKKLQVDYSELLTSHAGCQKKMESLDETVHKLSSDLLKVQNTSSQEKDNMLAEMKKHEAFSKNSGLKLMELQAEFHQTKLRCVKLENELTRLKQDGANQADSSDSSNDNDQMRLELEKTITENKSLSKSLESLEEEKENLRLALISLESKCNDQAKLIEEKDKLVREKKIEAENQKAFLEEFKKKELASILKMQLLVKSKKGDQVKYEQEIEEQRNKLSKIIQTKTNEIQQMKLNIDSLKESNTKLSDLVEMDKVKQTRLVDKINEIILGQCSTAKEMMVTGDSKSSGFISKRLGRHYIQISKENKKREFLYEELQKQMKLTSTEYLRQIEQLNKEKDHLESENSVLKEHLSGYYENISSPFVVNTRNSVSTIASSGSSFDSGYPLEAPNISSTPYRRPIKSSPHGKPPLNHLPSMLSLKSVHHQSKPDFSDVFLESGDEQSDIKMRARKQNSLDYRHTKSDSGAFEVLQQLEVNVKTRGKKMSWEKRFVKFDGQFLYFYRQDMTRYDLKLLANSLFFVRPASSADVIHAKKSEVPRIFQICYDKNEIFHQKALMNKSMSKSSTSVNSGDSLKSINLSDENDTTLHQEILEKKDSRKSSLSRFIPIIGGKSHKVKENLDTILDNMPFESQVFLRGHIFQVVNPDSKSTCDICSKPFDLSLALPSDSSSKVVTHSDANPDLLSIIYQHKHYQCFHCSIRAHGHELNSKIFSCKQSTAIQLCRAASEAEQILWIKYLNQFVKTQINTTLNSGAVTPSIKPRNFAK